MAKLATKSLLKYVGILFLVSFVYGALSAVFVEPDTNTTTKEKPTEGEKAKAKEELRLLTTTSEERLIEDFAKEAAEQDRKKREKIKELEKIIQDE